MYSALTILCLVATVYGQGNVYQNPQPKIDFTVQTDPTGQDRILPDSDYPWRPKFPIGGGGVVSKKDVEPLNVYRTPDDDIIDEPGQPTDPIKIPPWGPISRRDVEPPNKFWTPPDINDPPSQPTDPIKIPPWGPVSRRDVEPPNKFWTPPDINDPPSQPTDPIKIPPWGPVSRRDVEPPNKYWTPPKDNEDLPPGRQIPPWGPVSRRDVEPPNTYQWTPPDINDPPSLPTEPIKTPPDFIDSRDYDDSAEVAMLGYMMRQIIIDIQKEMSAAQISLSVKQIRQVADDILTSHGITVDDDDVMEVLSDIGEDLFDDLDDLSELFEDHLKFEARVLTIAFRLLANLHERLNQQLAAGEPIYATLAAISQIAELVDEAVDDTIDYLEEQLKSGEHDIDKRQGPVKPKLSLDVSKTWDFDGGSFTLKGSVSTDGKSTTAGVSIGIKF